MSSWLSFTIQKEVDGTIDKAVVTRQSTHPAQLRARMRNDQAACVHTQGRVREEITVKEKGLGICYGMDTAYDRDHHNLAKPTIYKTAQGLCFELVYDDDDSLNNDKNFYTNIALK